LRNASFSRTSLLSTHAHPNIPSEYIDFLVMVRPTLKAAAEESELWQREHRLMLLEQADRLIADMQRRWGMHIRFPIKTLGSVQ